MDIQNYLSKEQQEKEEELYDLIHKLERYQIMHEQLHCRLIHLSYELKTISEKLNYEEVRNSKRMAKDSFDNVMFKIEEIYDRLRELGVY